MDRNELTRHLAFYDALLVYVAVREADELLVAAEDGGYAEGLVRHVVAGVLGEGVVDEPVDILRSERYVGHVFHESADPQSAAAAAELAVVGGNECDRRHGLHEFDDGLDEGFALDGVGGSGGLVDKHQQSLAPHTLQYVADFDYLGGVGRKSVHLVLLIADGGDDALYGHEDRRLGRDAHAALCHELGGADGLEQHGLAGHVGTGDEGYAARHVDVDRLVAESEALVVVAQAGVEESGEGGVVAQSGTHQVPAQGELGLGQQEVGVSHLFHDS